MKTDNEAYGAALAAAAELYVCRIQVLKPEICRNYLLSKKHAAETRCPGFG
jgi:hypothetical protein